MRFRIIAPVFLKVLVSLLCFPSLDVYAEPGEYKGSITRDQTFSKQADFFYDHLIKLPESKSKNIFKEYKSAVAKELDMERLYFTTYQELIDLLDLAVKESIDVLTLFTLPVLQQQTNKAIVLDKDILIHHQAQRARCRGKLIHGFPYILVCWRAFIEPGCHAFCLFKGFI